MSGYFFVFDGMDGSGKSTALQSVAALLREQGHTVVTTREPGGSPLAEGIRECLLRDWDQPVPLETELLLVFAARAAHLQQTVVPALQRGAIVLCDRFVDSSFVYQGVLGGMDLQWIEQLSQRTITHPPDQVFIFDLPVELALSRRQQRSHSDRFDRQAERQQNRMRQAYLERAQCARRCLIDASQPAAALARDVAQRIQDQLK